jgi:hypothetical protein
VPFTAREPHITVAIVLTGAFGQIADPLDWVARQFNLPVKVNRVKLAESLAYAGGGAMRAAAPLAEAPGMDNRTRFRLQVAGRCEGRMVALCTVSFVPERTTLRALEEAALATTLGQMKTVLGVQLTRGAQYQTLDGIEEDAGNALVRLMPMNVFNKLFFRDQIERIEGDKKTKSTDFGEAMLVELTKPWQFYDVPAGRKKRAKTQPLALPFFQ